MLIIIDRKIPAVAKQNLFAYGGLMEIATMGVTYEAISGHPDIFFCPAGREMVVAPNLPPDYIEQLDSNSIPYTLGKLPVGKLYPHTAHYNAVFSDTRLIHHLELTDPVIRDRGKATEGIHVNQGYCRCNLIPLQGNAFITSDGGIQKVLAERGFDVLYVDPAQIVLPGFPHGFIGGACGIFRDQVFFIGSLRHHQQGDDILAYIRNFGYRAVELYDGPLFDGGGVLFME